MNNKKEIIKKSLTLGMLAILLVLAVTGTQSWFTVKNDVDINTLELEATQTENIYISKDGENWGYEVDFSDELENVLLEEVTSLDEGQTLSIPIRSGATGLPDSDSDWQNAIANENYIEIVFYIKSTRTVDLYLDYEETTVLPSETTDDEDAVLLGGEEDTIINKSAYGNFSNNYVAGATRIGLYQMITEEVETVEVETSNLLAVYAPNPLYQLTTTLDEITGINSFEFTPEGEKETFYYMSSVADETGKYKETAMADTSNNYPQNITGNNDDNTNKILTLEMDSNGDAIVQKVKLMIWIEGCDREAKEAFDGGIIDINISFIGKDVTTTNEEE